MKIKTESAFSLVLCLLMLFSITPFALGANSENGVIYRISGFDKAYVSGCEKDSTGEIVIASEYMGYPVTSVSAWAFKDCMHITDIVVPDSVTEIGYGAFKNCTSLKKVKLSNNVTNMDCETFKGCASLESIVLPDKLTYISRETFCGCSSLRQITVPENVTEMGTAVFKNCILLQSVKISDKLERIDEEMFFNCRSLKQIALPVNLKEIEREAFWGCNSLKSIILPEGLKKIGQWAFYDCDVKSVVIPKSVDTIEFQSLGYCQDSEHQFSDKKIDGFTIQGKAGSVSESYAKENGFAFYVLSEDCTCNCHKRGFAKIFWTIINFFNRFFKNNPICDCGDIHW